MATRRIRDFLNGAGVDFRSIYHDRAFTTQDVAELSHVPGRYMAKTIIVQLDGRMVMAVVPATALLNLGKLIVQSGSHSARLAEESEFRNLFDGCQTGAVPPFGNLFGMPTFVDRRFEREEHIAFNAGTHTDVFVIRYSDYARLVRPLIVDIAGEINPRAERHQVQCDGPILHHAGAD
jgi:Ala-tRNA(Pro) deacylase